MISDKTRNLFLFIELLHENIENFNQYENVILELYKARGKIYSLGTHFAEVREKKTLQKEIDKKRDIIFDNIQNPLKNTIAELGLFNWYKPETLSNIHLPNVLVLSENCEEEDVAVILKAKTQYIEFTSRISSNIINLELSLFDFLNEVMQVIVNDFKEEGDKPIKNIEEKHYASMQEAVSNFKSGETVSFPLQLEQNLAYANTDTNLSNNVEHLNNNTMVINYECIYDLVIRQADDPEQMKAYCISQQKIAERDYYFGEKIFYKGLLKVVVEKKELVKYQPKPGPSHIGDMFIAGGGGSGYSYENIELLEQMINEICNGNKEEQSKKDEYSHYTALQWGAIFYYVNSKILSDEITIESKLSTFKKKHNIKHTFKTFKIGYYNAYKKIIETNDYPTKKLRLIIPFFEQHYKKIVADVKNDIKVLKDYEAENQ